MRFYPAPRPTKSPPQAALVDPQRPPLRLVMARRNERGMVCAAAALAAALLATEARACDLPPPESASVAAVLDGETLKLADGRTVKLIGAKAPVAPLGWRGEDPWPFVEEA